MQYNTLGKTDLKVSRLCLGCMTFGEPDRGNHAWTLPEESSRLIIKRALEGGINFFDTANSYSGREQRGDRGPCAAGFRPPRGCGGGHQGLLSIW
ncbi:aldo/keto reductase [Lelliottia amnigena]|nr:aldo/keto reductase [Lelliottia amnigena]